MKNIGSGLLKVDNLKHDYGAQSVIDGLSLEVNRGEFVSIVGPSGSGKTTLLRSLSGLLKPTGGSVHLAGELVQSVPAEMALVFQDYSRSLFPWLTVQRNVAFPLSNSGLSRAQISERVKESLESVGLADAADKHPWQLSGGMQQRIAIARALAYRPSILLMDEPFASVDAQTRADLEDLVLDVWEQYQMTILFVTHDIDESVYLSDRVVVLSIAPAKVMAEIPINLDRPRDQVATKALPEFVEYRSEIATLIRASARRRGARV